MKTALEPLLRNATIRAIDGISKQAGKAEKIAGSAVGRLLHRWNDLDAAEKENVAAMVIATATTAVTAIVALKSKRKTVARSASDAAKKAVKKLTT